MSGAGQATSATMSAIARRLRDRRSLSWRLLWVAPMVALCYLCHWWWLRAVTTSTLVGISAALRIPMHRLGPDLIELNGLRVQFVVACTMIDAFFGAIPLLWRASLGLPGNLARLAVVFVAIFCLNIFRLEAGFAGLNLGLPWWLAHECVAGVAYFCLFLFIVHERAWRTTP